MKISSVPVGWEDQEEDLGCAFILDGDDGRRICGAARWSVSSYCPPHHVLCHVSYGSAAEADRMHEVRDYHGTPSFAPPSWSGG